MRVISFGRQRAQRVQRAASFQMLLPQSSLSDALPEWIVLPVVMINSIVLAVLYTSFELFQDGCGAPFVPIASQKLDSLFSSENGCLRAGGRAHSASSVPIDLQHLVDLGSGTGSVVRAAHRIGGYGRASGYEINPWLFRLSALASHGEPNERFHLVSLWDARLDDADVVVVYGYPSFIERLGVKLGAELREGAVVVSNAYPMPEGVAHLDLLEEIPVETPRWSPDASSSLWVYRVSRRSEGGSDVWCGAEEVQASIACDW